MKKTIKYVFTGVAIAAIAALASCSDDDKKKLPDVNGYGSADEVAADNLIGYWDFNGSNNESISNTAPAAAEGDSFTDGVKGQALSLDEGFLRYPSITALSGTNTFANVSVSAWVKIDNNNTTATSIFAITQPTGTQADWNHGPIMMMAETAKPPAYGDTLVVKGVFSTYISDVRYGGDNINDYGVRGTDFQTVKKAGDWVHLVVRWDGVGSNIDVYADGIRVSNNNFRHRTYNPGTGETGLGMIANIAPNQVVIGGFPNADTGFANSAAQVWQGMLSGEVDEIRVYNKTLTDLEIGSLYALELAGR
jgi:Concanavalin A-like lectin/glucanases superfamily